MDPARLFVLPGPKTILWRYETESGICAALPRYKATDETKIELFGVICANKTTGQTCFWDNSRGKWQRTPVDEKTDVSALTGGDRLIENCTNCHRGENPWVIDPQQPTASLPNIPYVPIGGKDWSNPKSNLTCGGCHAIPKLTFQYCNVLIDMVRKRAMPPEGGIQNNKEGKDLRAKVEAIVKECPPPPPAYFRMHSVAMAEPKPGYCATLDTKGPTKDVVNLKTCSEGNEQEFQYDANLLAMKTKVGDRCLEVEPVPGTAGAGRGQEAYRLVAKEACSGRGQQIFRFDSVKKNSPLWSLRDQWKAYCMTAKRWADGSSKAPDNTIRYQPCDIGPDQQWFTDKSQTTHHWRQSA